MTATIGNIHYDTNDAILRLRYNSMAYLYENIHGRYFFHVREREKEWIKPISKRAVAELRKIYGDEWNA